MKIAEQGLADLKKEVDAYIVIPNDRLLTIVDQQVTARNAFAMCDEILRQAVEGVSDIITTPGDINTDFNDIKAVMEGAGPALMGVGIADGDDRARQAAQLAVNSPLLDISINGAQGVLLAISGSDDLGILEVQEAAKAVTEAVDPHAKIIFGMMKDEKLKKGQVRVIVIATGFPEQQNPSSLMERSSSLFSLSSKEQTEEKGKIYNSILPRREVRDEEAEGEVPEEQPAPKTPPTPPRTMSSERTPIDEDDIPEKPLLDDDEDWGAIPSFLRRHRK